MELKALSPIMLTNAVALFEGDGIYLKADTLKDLVKNALIYEHLRRDKDTFDEFYKKLLWWFEFYKENKERRNEVKKQLEAVALWLEKKVLCGGEPEIVNGEVINYEEEKNLLNLLKTEDFLLNGGVEKLKVKLVGRAKRFIGVRKFAAEGSVFKGTLEVDADRLNSYEAHANKPLTYEVLKEGRLSEIVNRFALKVLETDKEFFADRGYSKTVRELERIEAESGERLMKVNYHGGILPYAAELFIKERIETAKGRKEYHHLNEIMRVATELGFASEIFKETRELTVGQKPIGWIMSL